MFGIVGGLLGGWVLGLFGFDGVVIEGMAQVFGVTIDKTGYYFLFGAMGALGNIASRANPRGLIDIKSWETKNKK